MSAAIWSNRSLPSRRKDGHAGLISLFSRHTAQGCRSIESTTEGCSCKCNRWRKRYFRCANLDNDYRRRLHKPYEHHSRKAPSGKNYPSSSVTLRSLLSSQMTKAAPSTKVTQAIKNLVPSKSQEPAASFSISHRNTSVSQTPHVTQPGLSGSAKHNTIWSKMVYPE